MNDKFGQYTDVITRLVSETVSCTPEQWNDGTLFIESDGVHITYKLKNDKQPEKAIISESLRDLIDKLYVRMSHNGHAWKLATVYFYREGNDLKFNTDFQYPEPASAAPKKTPWWQFWGGHA
jgi:hypothetical protein